jgi:hypothetical protein
MAISRTFKLMLSIIIGIICVIRFVVASRREETAMFNMHILVSIT